MMYLVDTNVFLEILLSQERKDVCKSFLDENIGNLYISDFSLHSIGVILFRNNKEDVFYRFVRDVMSKLEIITLRKDLYEELAEAKKRLELDFDDLYQYKVAKEHNSKIVTMDGDFEKVKDVEVVFLSEES